MRFLGALLFVLGGAGAGWSTWAAYHHRRPRDLAFALAAPLALVVALVGLLLCFVPRFFG